MADGSSTPFQSLLKSVGIKAPGKRLKFMPTVTEPPSSGIYDSIQPPPASFDFLSANEIYLTSPLSSLLQPDIF